MIVEIFQNTISQIAILFLFTVAGFMITRSPIMKPELPKCVSLLLANFFLPCMLIHSISAQFDPRLIWEYAVYFLSGVCVVALLWYPIKKLAARWIGDRPKSRFGILTYTMLFPNICFLGYALTEAVLPEIYLPLVIFGLPFTIAANTLGIGLLSDEKETYGLRQIFSPTILSTLCGILLAVLPISLPSFLQMFLSSAASCTSPLAMVLIGLCLGCSSLMVRSDKKLRSALWGTVLMRLLLLPATFGGIAYLICRLTHLPNTLAVTVVAGLCLPSGMNMLFLRKPTESADGDEVDIGVQCVLLTNCVSVLTLPLIYSLCYLVLR